MKVTLNNQNRAIEKQKKTLFAAHLKTIKKEDRENHCLSNRLKLQFDQFFQTQLSKIHSGKQKTTTKHYQFIKQTPNDPITKKILVYRDKQLSIHSQLNNPSLYLANPQQQHRSRIPINELKNCNKLEQLNHSTKANSRQKSRANSLQSSTICCNIVPREDKYINVETKIKQTVTTTQNHKSIKQNKKIHKITSPQISKITRIVMLDWMFQLSAEIQLPKQALYNSIDYIDKFITLSEVKKTQYQQVGLACLFLATKLEMSSHPKIQVFLEAIDNQLDRQVLIQTERKIVNTLRFRLNPPTLYQYMTVAILTIKTFKSEYKNISWINDLPSVQKDTFIYRMLSWIMDGVTMQGSLTNKHGKDRICLAILYVTMLFKINQDNQSPLYCNSNKKVIKNQSTAYSDNSFNSLQRSFSPFQEKQEKFSYAFDCFLRYATTSNKSVNDLQRCVTDLRKWSMFQCDCSHQTIEYHPELKQLAIQK